MAALGNSWSNFDAILDNPFALDISPLDFSVDDDLLEQQFGVPNISMLDDDICNSDLISLLPVPLHHDLQVPLVFQAADDVLYDDDGNEFGVWDDIIQQEISNTTTTSASNKRQREDSNNKLTKECVSQYFYMPISEAAKELKMGLTLLKKWCRELGIRRWPHRKLMSLKTLMKNVEEGSESEEKKREWMARLEEERRLIEEMPDLQMHHNTKRLRQSCFKENYKRRRRLITNNVNQLAQHHHDEEDDQLPCLLYSYSLSPLSDIMPSL